MRRNQILLSLAVALPAVALAGRKDRSASDAAEQGMMMPDLAKVLGTAWDVPPELSDGAQPGTVLELTEEGLRVVMSDCVEATPSERLLTNVSMQNSLSGGVGWGGSAVGGSAGASHSLKLSFQGPMVQGFELIDFVPSAACVAKLTAYAKRGGDVANLVVVQEALMARVSGCKENTGSAFLAFGRRGVVGSGSDACQMFSDAPVAVGLKVTTLGDIPELAEVGGAAAPRAATPAPPASTPAPASGNSRGKAGIEWVNMGRFEISKTEVTVAQYRDCLDAGVCSKPNTGGSCNWGIGRDNHPINCVDWNQASTFARWAGGRLPTGDEWAYAATSGGQGWDYPWGDEEATCARAVMSGAGGDGCGEGHTWPVCSKPAGNSSQGVCDLAGNVWEWTDEREESSRRVGRGGGWGYTGSSLRASNRVRVSPSFRDDFLGVRLAR